MGLPKVSIIILNWNGLNDTIECLESLKRIVYPNYEVIVVDNASSGKDVEILNKKFKNYMKLIKNDKNYGFAEGNNIAIRKIIKDGKSKYVLLLNNDTTVDKNFLNELIETAEGNNRIGVVGSKILYYYDKNKVWFSGGKIIEKIGFVRHLNSSNVNQKTDYITGCSMLIKIKAIIQNKRAFDKSLFMYCEDIQLCLDLRDKGYSLKISPNSLVYHKISKSSKTNQFIEYYNNRNKIRIFSSRNKFFKFFIIAQLFLKMIYKALKNRDLKIVSSFFKAVRDI
jgi:GT2 family glycosyltransferase